jgi:hypothetical protein
VKIELVDNTAGAQEACNECGTRCEFMTEVAGQKFPLEGLLFCPACTPRLSRKLAVFVRRRGHVPSAKARDKARRIPADIQQIAAANEALESARA